MNKDLAAMPATENCMMCGGRVPKGMACSQPCLNGKWPMYDKDKGGFTEAMPADLVLGEKCPHCKTGTVKDAGAIGLYCDNRVCKPRALFAMPATPERISCPICHSKGVEEYEAEGKEGYSCGSCGSYGPVWDATNKSKSWTVPKSPVAKNTHPIQQARDDLKPERIEREMHTNMPEEIMVAEALRHAGVSFIHESQDKIATLSLDFKIGNVFIEVKQGHSPRIVEQTSRNRNIIVLQGRKAVEFFCAALTAQPVTGDAALREALEKAQQEYDDWIKDEEGLYSHAHGFIDAASNLLKAFATVAPQPAQPAWRDISSAPKDGSEIILFNSKYKFLPKARWGEIDGESDDGVESWFNGWLLENDVYVGTAEGCLGYLEDIEDGLMPTHWMPLPAAPTNGEAA